MNLSEMVTAQRAGCRVWLGCCCGEDSAVTSFLQAYTLLTLGGVGQL